MKFSFLFLVNLLITFKISFQEREIIHNMVK